MKRFIAFLRGINVSGHHKLPMAELRKEMEKLKCKNVITILNSGNIIFDSPVDDPVQLESTISKRLEATFGFPVPTIIRTTDSLNQLLDNNPFKGIELTKDTRFYISFLQKNVESELELPWTNHDQSYRILEKRDNTISSVLDLSISSTPKVMADFEKIYGKDITTRNWNTILRIEKKIADGR